MSEPITTALRGLLCARPLGDPCWDAMDAVDAVHAALEAENAKLRERVAVLDNERGNMHETDAWKLGYDEGFANADDWMADNEDAMAEDGWVRLPKSIEDKPINEHDKVDWRDHAGVWHENATVVAVCNDGCYVMEGIVFHVHKSDIRHHHAQTVEDVLTEFAERWHDAKRGERTFDYNALVAEYAKRLRLAGDAE